MFRRVWALPMVALVCLMMLAACGQGEGAAPATATSGVSAPTSTVGVGASQGTATATPRQATATVAAKASTVASASKGDPKSIVLGKPVTVLATTARTVVAVAVKNTSNDFVTFSVKPKQRSSGKAAPGTGASVRAMPAGATWTVTITGDEFQARDYDLTDLSVESFFVVPQSVDPAVKQKIKAADPVITVEGKQTRAAVEMTNENAKRVSFRYHLILVKDGAIIGVVGSDMVLEPGETRKVPFLVDGSAEGATPQTQISNVGGL